jgi:hypothetical protein
MLLETGFGLVIGYIGHFNAQPVTTLYTSLSHKVTVFTALLGNTFQQWTILCSRAHVLAGWRPSHTNLLDLSKYAAIHMSV